MKRLFIRIREDQDTALRKFPGSIVEHIRRAIDNYIQFMEDLNTAASLSKREGSDKHGKSN